MRTLSHCSEEMSVRFEFSVSLFISFISLAVLVSIQLQEWPRAPHTPPLDALGALAITRTQSFSPTATLPPLLFDNAE